MLLLGKHHIQFGDLPLIVSACPHFHVLQCILQAKSTPNIICTNTRFIVAAFLADSDCAIPSLILLNVKIYVKPDFKSLLYSMYMGL